MCWLSLVVTRWLDLVSINEVTLGQVNHLDM